jgi:diadenosine tetraphosphate (Ap4A) HIT family hydrolase
MKSSIIFDYPPPVLESTYDQHCISCSLPEHQREAIAFSTHWNVIAVPQQFLPGYCLIVARRHIAMISELSTEEWSELYEVNRILEPALIKTFGADLVNFECLRNNAFRVANPVPPFKNGQPNPHVHWHVMPRYSKPVEILDRKFSDECFGSPYHFRAPKPDWELCDHIVQLLRPHFKPS